MRKKQRNVLMKSFFKFPAKISLNCFLKATLFLHFGKRPEFGTLTLQIVSAGQRSEKFIG